MSSAAEPELVRSRHLLTGYFAGLGLVTAVWGARLPAVQQAAQLSTAGLALVLLAAALGMVAGLQTAGRLAHPARLPALVTGGAIGLAACLAALGACDSLDTLLVVALLFGVAHGVLDVGVNSAAVRCQDAIGRPIMGAFHASYSIGALLGAALAAGSAHLSYTLLFVAVGTVTGAAACTAARANRCLVTAAPELAPGPGQAVPQTGGGLSRGRLWLLGALAAATLLGEGAAADWAAVHLHGLGATAAVSAAAFALYSRTPRRRPAHRPLRRPRRRTHRCRPGRPRSRHRPRRLHHRLRAGRMDRLRPGPVRRGPQPDHRRWPRRPPRGRPRLRHRLRGPARRARPHRRPRHHHLPDDRAAAARSPRRRRRRPVPQSPGEPRPLTTPATSPTTVNAVIIDYNGVIGRQPATPMWRRLATLAEWPADQLDSFRDAFWAHREAYDAGELSDLAYWAKVLGHHPSPRWLRTLSTADTAMWTRTDPDVLGILSRARAAGTPMVLLSNAPHFLADVLDATDWRRELMTDAVYSARLGLCKPDPAAYEQARAATGIPDPGRVLFVDDRADNCDTASRLGMRTLHYTGQPADLAQELLPAPANSPCA